MKRVKRAIKIKLLVINMLVGSGLVHLEKHDPHIHGRNYKKKYGQDVFLVLKTV